MREFGASEANKFLDLMVSKGLLSEEESGTVAHALMDVRESVEKSVLEEYSWDIREEFRHVDYHVHDAGFAHSHFDDAD